jgi:hypothetical protein
MPHVVLLGDSIFDNAAYTRGAPDVIQHLRAILPDPWRATLCAIDGATTASMAPQLRRVPADATDLVVSIGGNDALGHRDLLSTRVSSTAEALTLFRARVQTFESEYIAAIDGVLSLNRPLTLCTIYNGNLPDPREASLARTALTLFNDVIVRAAFGRGTGLIDLRLVCSDAADYANPIEPSGIGGRKIAHAIAHAVGALSGPPGVAVFVG